MSLQIGVEAERVKSKDVGRVNSYFVVQRCGVQIVRL